MTAIASRLWCKDASLWRADDHAAIRARLGWLDSIAWMRARADELQAWAAQVAAGGEFDRAIVLGMGGSSLAPAVFASLFAPTPRGLALQVLDSTCPDEIARVAGDGANLSRCLFIVASKSGDTLETLDLHRHFHARVAAQHRDPESRFVLITDAGTPLHRRSESGRFRRVFINPDDIGGRYSALSCFGLVPAALLGVDLDALLARAQTFADSTRVDDPQTNPALALGMLLGRGAREGRDKLILDLPDDLAAFGLWIEQLVAESTGKDGRGLVPVVQPRSEGGLARGDDQLIVRIDLARDADAPTAAARDADHAVRIDSPLQLGAEFFRWEFATAVAASHLRVNPFDQPDVARSKAQTRTFIQQRARLESEVRGGAYDLRYRHPQHDDAAALDSPDAILAHFRRALTAGAYLALLAYLPQQPRLLAALQSLRARAARRARIAVTVGIGPRYLHSTAQLHKGGPPSARFIQLVAAAAADWPVPERDYTFAQLCRAQADGDFETLARGGATILRVDLKADRIGALTAFASAAFPADSSAPD